MKKRFLALIMAMLMLVCVPASAASLFTLPDISETEAAISYGVRMNVTPISETTMTDGSQQQVYDNVTDQTFTDFGVILNESGYTLGNQSVDDGIIVADVIKGGITFSVKYDRTGGMLTVIYPLGVSIEMPEVPNPFEGYIELQFGEKVRTAYGDIMINEFHLDEKLTAVRTYGKNDTYNLKNAWTLAPYFLATFDNISTKDIGANLLFNYTLHYINSDNHYTYIYSGPQVHFDIGIVVDEAIASFYWYIDNSYSHNLPSMEITKVVGGFSKVPDRVLTSTDGILAITFEFAGVDTPYVLYIRK